MVHWLTSFLWTFFLATWLHYGSTAGCMSPLFSCPQLVSKLHFSRLSLEGRGAVLWQCGENSLIYFTLKLHTSHLSLYFLNFTIEHWTLHPAHFKLNTAHCTLQVRDLYIWWFETQCSSGKLRVVARSWEEVNKDPRWGVIGEQVGPVVNREPRWRIY